MLIEFFHGYASEPETRFVHAIERFQGLRFPIDFRRGSLADNVMLCRMHKVSGWRDWWARTLAFDAIIGNTDRHTENWGFLIDPGAGRNPYQMAPAFDNGTSLGYIIGESQLARFTKPDELQRLINRGRHHFGRVAGDTAGAQHADLCKTYRGRYPSFGNAMDDALNLTDDRIDRIVEWCSSFDFALPFTQARATFVAAQLRGRRNALAAVLGA